MTPNREVSPRHAEMARRFGYKAAWQIIHDGDEWNEVLDALLAGEWEARGSSASWRTVRRFVKEGWMRGRIALAASGRDDLA